MERDPMEAFAIFEMCICPACEAERAAKRAAVQGAVGVGEKVSNLAGTPDPKPRKYEVGDEVELKVRVDSVDTYSQDMYIGTVLNGGRDRMYWSQGDLDSGKLTPRPIQVGDRVSWGFGIVNYTVIAINDDGQAWLKEVDGGGRQYGTMPVAKLERVS